MPDWFWGVVIAVAPFVAYDMFFSLVGYFRGKKKDKLEEQRHREILERLDRLAEEIARDRKMREKED